jgi:hypothetical protein
MNKLQRRNLINWFICSWLITFASCAASALPLRIEATPSTLNQTVDGIKFSLTNISEKTIQINETAVPWGERTSILLVAMIKRTHELLRPEGYVIDDNFLVKTIRIAPGETISGTVSLSQHFGNINSLRKKGDLLVFWHFRAIGKDAEELGEYGGWLNISFKKPDQK